jgi:RNA polymerase sigma-70 factor, ECF subfamily
MTTLKWNWFVGQADQPSEADLIPALQQRNPQAFGLLVEEHTPRMLAVARRFLRSEDDCQDALQDAYISAYKALPQFHQQSKLGTWLHRIVVNACLMKLRKQSRRSTVALDDILPDCSEELAEESSETPAAAVALEQLENRTMLHDCIGQLNTQHQEVIHLRDLQELSTEQVALQLGITPGAVKTRLHRAHQALKQLLHQHEFSGSVC